jgi:ubiquitin carboxyl-terminal hydrolase 8
MSSAATAGPPSSRIGITNGDGPAGEFRPPNGAKKETTVDLRGPSRTYPHIDDLVAAKPDINALASIRKLLAQGELYAKQAETHLDFRRPEIALQEYVKASTIVVDVIPRHKDYPDLKSDRGELHRLYAGLQKRINSQHDKFERIKDIIKEDNVRSGVRSAVRGGFPASRTIDQEANSSHSLPVSSQLAGTKGTNTSLRDNFMNGRNLSSSEDEAQVPPSRNPRTETARQKPQIQPKPDALQGRLLKPDLSIESSMESSEVDLAARFARLRGIGSHTPLQDPRIRTRPIGMLGAEKMTTKPDSSATATSVLSSSTKIRVDRPSGPRDMPKVPSGPPRPQKIPLDVDVPSLPKIPDAIYSPSWNLDNQANLDTLRSSSRNMYGDTRKSVALASSEEVPRTLSTPKDRIEPFDGMTSSPRKVTKRSAEFNFPDVATVTAEELMGYLQRGSHELYVLLVDIRDREDFDNGHIMSQSIICIDPIVLRGGISAEEIAQSLILSPETEQNIFDTRDSFDIVVYYDQSSTSIDNSIANGNDGTTILDDFGRAIYDYGYEKRVRQRPKLLLGGLDAWIDLVGPGALEISDTSGAASLSRGRKTGQFSARASTGREKRKYLATRRTAYESRPLSREAELKWLKILEQQERASVSSLLEEATYVRTTEDFFRRFPEATTIQESMVSPSPLSGSNGSHTETHHTPEELAASIPGTLDGVQRIPTIPTRPPPSLPRKSYSGISERRDLKTSSAAPLRFKETESITPAVVPFRHTGLKNPNTVTCYMNSIFQALNWTDVFTRHLTRVDPTRVPKPPRKPGEATEHPQILVQYLGNLLRRLSSQHHESFYPKEIKVGRLLLKVTLILS